MPGRLYGAVAPFPNPVDDPSNSYIFSGGRGTGKSDRRDVTSSSSPLLGTLSSDEDDESTALIAATADAGVTAAVTAETSGAAVATETSATDAIELRVRATRDGTRMAGERPPLADVVFLEREVREGDSLVTFALQYGCSVSDIKRANNLMSEQGMYALRSVRIPVRRHGLLTDAVEEARRRPLPPPSSSSTTSSLPATACASVATDGSSLPTARLAAVPAPPSPMASPAEVAATAAAVAFLRVMDRDIANIARRTDVSKASLEEVTQALTEKRFHPLGPRQHLHQLEFRQDNHQQQLEGSSHHRRRKDSCDGADCGIRWWSAVAVMLLVGVAMPLVYYAFHAVRARLDSPAPLAGEDDPAAAAAAVAAAAAAAAEAGGIPGKGEQQRQGQQHERQQQQVRRLVSRFLRAPIELRSTPDGTLPTVASKQIPAASG